jgi:hypothetical protein
MGFRQGGGDLNSNVAVVTTNEKQWAAAFGKIMSARLYKNGEDTSLPCFTVANVLQEVYLMGTRQEMIDPPRPFSPHDFKYLFETLLGSSLAHISSENFNSLWEWLGQMVCACFSPCVIK